MTPDTSIQTAYDELVAAIVKAVPEIMDFRQPGFRFKFNEKIFTFDGNDTDKEKRPWLTKPTMVLVSPRGLRGDSPWQTSDVRNMDYIFKIEETGEVLKCSFIERQGQFRECIDAIGCPITLEDVLRAASVEHVGPDEVKADVLKLAVNNWGQLVRLPIVHGEDIAIWHLGHDLAWHRDNAPETIRFLHSLLV